MIRFALCVALAAVACGPGAPGGPTMNNKIGGNQLPEQPMASSSTVVSKDILAREPISNSSEVKHILISWKDKADAFGGRQDPRGQKRTQADAERDVRAVLAKIQAGADFDQLMKEYSEDVGSAMSARPFTVTPDAQLVIEFRQLGTRLRVGEIGVVESDYGFHIMKRIR